MTSTYHLSRHRAVLITIGVMVGIFLSSMEGTVVATAMPSIVGQLGGLSIYSWVFSIYMLTSTTTVPIYGKLSDLFGRRLMYVISVALFLAGSVLCAQAHSMQQLILFRGVQGVGAGGILPLAFTIIGELFTWEQRAKLQGVISGVWGVSSVIGPLIGGFLVDQASWQWVFYVNVIPGLLAAGLVWFFWETRAQSALKRPQIDIAGALLLTLATLSLLLGLNQMDTPGGWILLGAFILLLSGLIWVERRAPDPILPLRLLRGRLFLIAILHGVLSGWAMFGSLSYIPLYVQAVLGTTATQAGISLTPMSLSWTVASIFGGWLLLRMSYRSMAMMGMALLTAGALLMSLIGAQSSMAIIMFNTSLMGIGMGLSIPAFLIGVQSTVRKQDLGSATSAIQFSRSIGGTVGVSVMGALLNVLLAARLAVLNMESSSVSLNDLVDRASSVDTALQAPLRAALGLSMSNMFVLALLASLAGWVAVFFAPRGSLVDLEQESTPT